MTPRQIFWHNLKVDVASLGVGHYTERDQGPTPLERIAAQIRAEIGGPWRAYLPGSTYFVRVVDRKVRITRTG